jgi:hypothetical protein
MYWLNLIKIQVRKDKTNILFFPEQRKNQNGQARLNEKKISILRRISKWGIRIFLAGNRQRLSESLAKYFTLYEMADEPWMMTKSMMLFYQALYYHSLNPTLH